MSKLPHYSLAGTIYVASDIHLGPHIPLTNQVFFTFLQQASQEADALILAGDIFNVWFGDDIAITSQEPWLQQSLAALRACAKQIPVYIIHGNRDFLIGQTLCHSLGITLLPEQCLLHTNAGVVFISHGDELCTQDHAYMRFRAVLRNPWLQRLFLSLPFGWRRNIARFLRNRSEASHQQNTSLQQLETKKISTSSSYSSGYDVASSALTQLIEAHPEIDYIVHGHTHQQAIHDITGTDGKLRLRYVLSDWDIDHHSPTHWGFLAIRDGKLSYHPT